MLIERGIIRVGIEIEIASFDMGHNYQEVAVNLLDAGYMLGNADLWEEYHRYGCDCEPGGCYRVRSGEVYIPPLVSLTYDASLPRDGAEFVTSTIILSEKGLGPLKEIWDIVTEHAVWRDDLEDRNGNIASPSVHLHVSATQPNVSLTRMLPAMGSLAVGDVLHALSLFGPEFIALASTTENTRGLTFRQPIRQADQGGHHGFIHCRNIIPDKIAYIEWRMFEAAYDDWDYVQAGAYLAAAITRSFLSPNAYQRFMAQGFVYPIDNELLFEAVNNNDTEALLRLVSIDRLHILRDICITELSDDDFGLTLLNDLFDRTENIYA